MSGATSHRQAVDAAWAAYGDRRDDRQRRRGQRQRLDQPRLPRAPRRRLDGRQQGVVVRLVLPVRRGPRAAQPLRHAARRRPGSRACSPTSGAATAASSPGTTSTCGRCSTTTCRARESLPRILTPRPDRQPRPRRSPSSIWPAPTSRRCCPARSKTIKSDAIHLLDLLESPFAPRNFDLPPESIGVLWKHTHRFLERLVEVGYDEWPKIPILIDWNLGNFSVDTAADGRFRLFSRWDYDWFRIEPRLLDFYFLSRVSSSTGDRTRFTYGPHTLVEPSFLAFLDAYRERVPDERRRVALPARGVPLLHPQLRRARGRPVLPPRPLHAVPPRRGAHATCPRSTCSTCRRCCGRSSTSFGGQRDGRPAVERVAMGSPQRVQRRFDVVVPVAQHPADDQTRRMARRHVRDRRRARSGSARGCWRRRCRTAPSTSANGVVETSTRSATPFAAALARVTGTDAGADVDGGRTRRTRARTRRRRALLIRSRHRARWRPVAAHARSARIDSTVVG